MSDEPSLTYYRYRISRDPKRLVAWFTDNWAHNRKLRAASLTSWSLSSCHWLA